MARMTVSLPDALREWVETEVESGRYATTDDFVRALIDRDKAHSGERAALIAALERGEQSGTSARQVPDILEALRAEQANLNE